MMVQKIVCCQFVRIEWQKQERQNYFICVRNKFSLAKEEKNNKTAQLPHWSSDETMFDPRSNGTLYANFWRNYCCKYVFHSFIEIYIHTQHDWMCLLSPAARRTKPFSSHNANKIRTHKPHQYTDTWIHWSNTHASAELIVNYINYSSDEPNACFWPIGATVLFCFVRFFSYRRTFFLLVSVWLFLLA